MDLADAQLPHAERTRPPRIAGNGPQRVPLLLLWLLAIVTFGYPAIILPALTAVPVMFVLLILITKG